VEALGRNFQAFLNTQMVQWRPPSDQVLAKPHKLPKPQAEKRRPPVELIQDEDPVVAWQMSKVRMTKLTGDPVLARELLLADADGRSLFKLATKVACAAEAKRRKVVSISPSQLEPRL
jgi:hypothetical protein